MRTGIVIGGPMDGCKLSHEGEFYSYEKLPDPPTEPIDYSNMTAVQAAMLAESNRGQYYYTDMAVFGAGDAKRSIGFWVERNVNLDGALDAILTRYQEPRKEKWLLKRASRIIYDLLRSLGRPTETEFREARDVIDAIERTTDES